MKSRYQGISSYARGMGFETPEQAAEWVRRSHENRKRDSLPLLDWKVYRIDYTEMEEVKIWQPKPAES